MINFFLVAPVPRARFWFLTCSRGRFAGCHTAGAGQSSRYCQYTFLAKRCTSSSSLRSKLFLSTLRATIRRMHRRGRPALLTLPPLDADHGAKQVWRFFDLTKGPRLVGKLWRQARFDLRPGPALGQHRQPMTRVDHLIEAAAKEVVSHRLGPSKLLRKLSVSQAIF